MTNVDDYVNALELELRDQPRRVRRAETADLREHLEELPDGALDELEPPEVYALEYRSQRGLRTRKIRRNWRRTPLALRIAGVALLLVLLATAVVVPWVAHYQPVTADPFGGGPNAAPAREEHDATVYSYRDGSKVNFDIALENPGHFDATITGVDDGPLLGVLKFSSIRVFEKYPAGCCLPEDATPSRFPLRVPAGSTVGLHLELRMTNCEYYGNNGQKGGGSVGYNELRFPMKIRGVHHVLVAVLPTPIYVDMPGPKTAHCPRAQPEDLAP